LTTILSEIEAELETEPELVYALERNRGWLALQGHIAQRQQAKERILMGAVMRGEAVDQRQVDYLRGYFDALEWMTGLPVRMRSKLKEEGKRAE
jgi:hypothetical protein